MKVYNQSFLSIIMKYLIYFRPNKELTDLILSQNHIVLPGSGLHSTLCSFYMEPEQEYYLVDNLSKIKFNQFKIETQEFDNFDRNSLVLKLSRPDELLQLHKNIFLCVKTYANQEFDKMTKQYFWDNYNPHLTISESSSNFDRNSTRLFGRSDIILRYHLAKKIEENWKEIQTFYSRE